MNLDQIEAFAHDLLGLVTQNKFLILQAERDKKTIEMLTADRDRLDKSYTSVSNKLADILRIIGSPVAGTVPGDPSAALHQYAKDHNLSGAIRHE